MADPPPVLATALLKEFKDAHNGGQPIRSHRSLTTQGPTSMATGTNRDRLVDKRHLLALVQLTTSPPPSIIPILGLAFHPPLSSPPRPSLPCCLVSCRCVSVETTRASASAPRRPSFSPDYGLRPRPQPSFNLGASTKQREVDDSPSSL